MGCSYNSISSLINRSLLISFLLIMSSTQMICLVKGHAISRLLEVAAKVGDEEMFVRSQIGSRPPSCQRSCSSCGHCEAIQVPAVPQARSIVTGHSSMESTISSRAEYSSNYKPMNWKCKCGDRIFNP